MKSKFNIYIDDKLKENIKIQAIKEGRTASNIIEELIYSYLDNEGYLLETDLQEEKSC